MCSTCFPRSGLPADASLSSTGSSRESSPASTVLSKRYDFLPPIPPHFVSFAWRYLGCTRLSSLLDGRVRRQGLELVTRYLRPGCCRGNDRISQVPGEPQLSVCTCSNPTPAGLLAPDHYGAAAWPLVFQKQRLPRKVFRSSIAWLSDSLSTLRRVRCLTTTQDSLPVAGQALPDGLSTHKIPVKGFKIVSLHVYPPLPSFAWHKPGGPGCYHPGLPQTRTCAH